MPLHGIASSTDFAHTYAEFTANLTFADLASGQIDATVDIKGTSACTLAGVTSAGTDAFKEIIDGPVDREDFASDFAEFRFCHPTTLRFCNQ